MAAARPKVTARYAAAWKPPRRCGDAGFTLIELLVCISIIAVLLGMLLPSLSHSKELARRVACANKLRSLGTGLSLYAGEHDGVYPVEELCGNPQHVLVPALYDSYVSSRDVFYCPNAGKIERYAQSSEYGGPGGDSVINTNENWERHYITYKYFSITSRDTRMPLPLRLCEYPHLLTPDSPAVRWLMSDWVRKDVPVFPHWQQGGYGGGRNVLFVDTSVRFVPHRTPNAFTERQ
jgi:prepilin-type N-terminal cleavage/methylation domain-containing protein/prepilin-type processing-associated H-X9-DG protein